MIRLILTLCLAPLPLWSQIYADFTVSQGGTPLGTFRARLDHDKAPRTCANFIGLATGQRQWLDVTNGKLQAGVPYYNGLTFHRLIHHFMIQGGSPNGTGTDGPGYTIQDEFHPDLRHSGRYILSMAKTSLPHTTGGQFFITLAEASWLDDVHSVFGEVIDGQEIIDAFANAAAFPTDGADKPLVPIVMDSVQITGLESSGFDMDDPAHALTRILSVTGALSVIPGGAVDYAPAVPLAAGQQLSVFRSLDLSSWSSLRSMHAGYDTAPVATGRIDTASNAKAFYRLVQVEYPESKTPGALANRTLVVDAPGAGGIITLEFDASGSGGSCHYTGGTGSSGTIEYVDYAPSGYGATLVVDTSNLIPLLISMGLDGESSTEITGQHSLRGWNGVAWGSDFGSGAVALTK